MATLLQPPLTTPVPIVNGILSFLGNNSWIQFFNSLYNALNRQSFKVTIGPFTNVSPQTYATQFITMPVANAVGAFDFVLFSQIPVPQGTFIHIQSDGAADNKIIVYFHNYSPNNKSMAAAPVYITVIPNSLIPNS